MTATDIYEHPEYFNADFSFPDEHWSPIGRARFTRYKKSNYFRVKNVDRNYIMRPGAYGRVKVFGVKLKNDDGENVRIRLTELFDGFDVETIYQKTGSSEFIMNAF